MAEHARLAPSDAKRWMGCAGSIEMTKDVPDKAEIWSAEGTVFHDLMAQCLEQGADPYERLGKIVSQDGFEIEIDDEMCEHAQTYLDWVAEQSYETFCVEFRAPLDDVSPDQFGTCDLALLSGKTLTIVDWKYGMVAVYAKENEQLLLYAHAMRRVFEEKFPGRVIEKFVLAVKQPRVPGGGGSWECDRDYLDRFVEKAQASALRTFEKAAERTPSLDACTHCKANFRCPEFQAFNLELIGLEFDDLDSAENLEEKLSENAVERLTPERKAEIVKHAPMINKFLGRVYDTALEDALAGRPLPGLKVIRGRASSRKWEDPEFAELMLGFSVEDPYTRKLKSPSQVEKETGKKNFAKIGIPTFQSEGRPTLVSEENLKPALSSASDEFNNLDEGD